MGGGTGIRTVLWRKGGGPEEGFPFAEISDHLKEEGSLVWVDIAQPDHRDLQALAEELDLDEFSVEDAVDTASRAKATMHERYGFVNVYATRLDLPTIGTDGEEQIDPDEITDSRLKLTQISIFVMHRGLVTVRSNDEFDMHEVMQRWRDNKDLLQYGGGALLHGLLDTVVDGHFDTVQQLDDAIESLEDGLFDDSALTKDTQQRTFRIRKELVELRRVVLPMREVVGAVMRHRVDRHLDGNQLDGWYADLYDHTIRVAEWTESLRDMVTSVFETSLSLQDARLNTIMKKLTAWAAIIAVPTAVTGWFGQNVPYPGYQQSWGVFLTAGIILAVAASLYVVFKRRDWL